MEETEDEVDEGLRVWDGLRLRALRAAEYSRERTSLTPAKEVRSMAERMVGEVGFL